MKNKVAIVTGGSMGYEAGGPTIGGASAIQLAKDGFDVIVVDLLDMGAKTVEIIESNGGKAKFIKADVTDTDEIKKIIRIAKQEFGGLNCLVNCVAKYWGGMFKNIVDISEEDWTKLIDIDLNSYFKMAKYSIPLMLGSGGGTIVNVSSCAAFNVGLNDAPYAVAKAAINALTRTIAVDFAPKIRANAVCPGFVRIANSENNRTPEQLKEWYQSIAKEYPMRRVCEVEEIANAVSFLAGDKSSYINGQSIIIDGGRLISSFRNFEV